MSKKKNNPSEEQPISTQTSGTAEPTRQVSPMSLPPDSMPKVPKDQTRTIPIGTPISAEEMEKLKKESSKPTKKNQKKKLNQKAPDNNP